ncbi:hypothetical protein [Ectobacillus antri]|jgi:DHA3 family macrolide efflux protein-like MFS transporter|uniref:hypothetical protein n=1 Tax=Ectobacillus antri TaxID=2486280 RepID=UPI000F5A5B28|nr:hypothetical protein [Ectobacillus antri]
MSETMEGTKASFGQLFQKFIRRVNGILNPLFMGTMVISMSASGWLKTHMSIVYIYEVAAVLLALGILTLVPLMKKRRNEATAEGM